MMRETSEGQPLFDPAEVATKPNIAVKALMAHVLTGRSRKRRSKQRRRPALDRSPWTIAAAGYWNEVGQYHRGMPRPNATSRGLSDASGKTSTRRSHRRRRGAAGRRKHGNAVAPTAVNRRLLRAERYAITYESGKTRMATPKRAGGNIAFNNFSPCFPGASPSTSAKGRSPRDV